MTPNSNCELTSGAISKTSKTYKYQHKFGLLASFLILSLSITYYSCETATDTEPVYKGFIQGWVYEDSTKTPITGVKIFANEIPDTIYTNDSGRFHFTKISMPRSEYTYHLVLKKSGYDDTTVTANLKSDIETRIDSVFMKIHK